MKIDKYMPNPYSLKYDGILFELKSFYLISGYFKIQVDAACVGQTKITSCSLTLDGAELIRESLLTKEENKLVAYEVLFDGLLFDKSDKKSPVPPGFAVQVSLSDGRSIKLERDDLFRSYAGQYNPTVVDFWEKVRAKKSGLFLEIGGRGQASAAVRNRVPEGWKYLSVDVHAGDNVDIVCDIHSLSGAIGPETVDVVYSSSVMEHIFQPWLAILECNKVLKHSGIMFTAAPNSWPLHASPWDFWRFMDGAWSSLFNNLSGFEILSKSTVEPVKIVPVVMTTNRPQLPGADGTWLQVACLARKIGSPQQTWKYHVSAVDGVYPESAVLRVGP